MPYDYYQIQQLEVLELYKSGSLLGDIRISRIDLLSALFPCSEHRQQLIEKLQMTDKEELFAKFFSQAYNKGKDIDSMSLSEVDAWIRELEIITFEAKASLQGATQAKREREANLKASEREKLRNSDGSYNASDAINAVTKRKDRISKVDKLEQTYRALGMSDEDIKSLLSKVKIDEDKQPTATKLHLVPEIKEKSLLEKIADSVVNAAPSAPSVPFDASTLFGKKG